MTTTTAIGLLLENILEPFLRNAMRNIVGYFITKSARKLTEVNYVLSFFTAQRGAKSYRPCNVQYCAAVPLLAK